MPEFHNHARVILSQADTEGLRSVQLAKDTVVRDVYPLEENREALGLKLLEHPEQNTRCSEHSTSRSRWLPVRWS